MNDVNIIVTCGKTECPHNHEQECGKDILYLVDEECLEQMKGEK